jgi:hypothetical protein
MTPFVLISSKVLVTWSTVASGVSARMRADAPATCGHAIEVPLSVLVAESLRCPADRILEPGAKMSMHFP